VSLPIVLSGRVQSGSGSASHFLGKFNAAYARKTGMAVFPGSLNVRLDAPFDWLDPRWAASVINFSREEYGGERDILLLPCRLSVARHLPAFLWSTTNASRDPDERYIAEVIAPVGLRATYDVKDGDAIAIELLF
jgi:riboflavin kinase, archaea type